MNQPSARPSSSSSQSANAAVLPDPAAPCGQGAHLPFRTLLYRYWFFAWLFRDVGRGSLFERAAAWRHNREQARWLPRYMKRWCVIGAVTFAAAALFELAGLMLLATCFFIPSVISLPVNAVIGAAWLGFKLMPAPG
jgi:fatty acid desaturase